MALFDLEEKQNTIINDNNGKMSIRKNSYKKIARVENRDSYFKENIEPISMPSNSECVLIKTNGLSDTGSIFRFLIEKENCKELYLSTWIISRENIDSIINALKDQKLHKVIFVVSTRLKQLKKSTYAYLVEQFEQFPNQVYYKVCNSHAKTFSLSTEHNYYTIIGSGNWTENPRIENYIIHNDKAIFDFNVNWMKDLCKCPL